MGDITKLDEVSQINLYKVLHFLSYQVNKAKYIDNYQKIKQ